MIRIFFDVETVPGTDAPNPEAILDQHPKSMSKPETIRKWAEENADKAWRDQSLKSLQGRMVSLGWALNDGPVHVVASPIPDEEWAYVVPHLRRHHFARGEHLSWEGRASDRIHFVWRGSVRAYYLADGREMTRSFVFEGRFAAGVMSDGRPAHVSKQALEATDTVSLPASLLPELYARHRCWERIGRRIAEEDWINKEEKELRFRLYTPEEHYAVLLAAGSLMTRRVPLRHLASYLGITPETLSRIRGRMARRAA